MTDKLWLDAMFIIWFFMPLLVYWYCNRKIKRLRRDRDALLKRLVKGQLKKGHEREHYTPGGY